VIIEAHYWSFITPDNSKPHFTQPVNGLSTPLLKTRLLVIILSEIHSIHIFCRSKKIEVAIENRENLSLTSIDK
jgi:hypothetical protein